MKLADLKKMSDDLGLQPVPTKNKIGLLGLHSFKSYSWWVYTS